MSVSEQDWKQKYYECVKELDALEKDCLKEKKALVSSIGYLARVAEDFGPDGLHDGVSQLQVKLRAETKAEDIEPLVRAVYEQAEVTTESADVLSELLQFISAQLPPSEELKLIHNRLAGLRKTSDILAILRDLTDCYKNAGNDDDHPSHELDTQQVSDALRHLVDAMPIGPGPYERLRTLWSEITPVTIHGLLPGLLEATADTAGELRGILELQRAEFQNFLNQLSERLSAINTHLDKSQARSDEAEADGQALHETMDREVQALHQTLSAENNLNSLKAMVSEKLGILQEQVTQYRAAASQRHQDGTEDSRLLRARMQQLEQESQQLKAALEEQRRLALRDPLTQLNNRAALEGDLNREFARWKRHGHPLSVLFIDVDHFKKLNDTYGHRAGDRALQLIARIMHEELRTNDILARYGGEEFVVLLPDTRLEDAAHVADKLREKVATCRFRYRGQPVQITMSCGLAQYLEGDELTSALERADACVYQAKSNGRNQTVAEMPAN